MLETACTKTRSWVRRADWKQESADVEEVIVWIDILDLWKRDQYTKKEWGGEEL